MDATIYRNVADIHLKSMAYLTVTIIYRCFENVQA